MRSRFTFANWIGTALTQLKAKCPQARFNNPLPLILNAPPTPDIKFSQYIIMYHNGEYLVLGGLGGLILSEWIIILIASATSMDVITIAPKIAVTIPIVTVRAHQLLITCRCTCEGNLPAAGSHWAIQKCKNKNCKYTPQKTQAFRHLTCCYTLDAAKAFMRYFRSFSTRRPLLAFGASSRSYMSYNRRLAT